MTPRLYRILTMTKHKLSSLTTPEQYLKRKHGQLKYQRNKSNPELCWEITEDDLIFLWKKQEGRCAVTNLHMNHQGDLNDLKNASLDRVDNDKGYTRKNIRLVCLSVNKMRGSLTESEFHWWIKQIYIGELL